jgi:hypothetical protein
MNPARRCLFALLIALAALPAAAAQPLPRIFFSPPQRATITQTRNATPATSDSIAISVTSTPASSPASTDAAPRGQRLEGIVLARTGERFAWIGGRRYADGGRFGPWRLRISTHGVALLRDGGVERQLRVGEAVGVAAVASAAP